jgi:putative hydrolase of the HAD superfamily
MKFALFDAYGTLVELDDFYNRLHRAFTARDIHLPVDVVARAARAEMGYYVQHTVGAKTEAAWLALKRQCAEVLAESLRDAGHDITLATENVLEILEEALVFRVFPETLAVLRELRERGVGLGVLSNWDGSLRGVLQAKGLLDYFQFVFISAECGVQKPDKAFFTLALNRIREAYPGLLARDCVYIGDHYDGDITGARGVGMTPLWLVRKIRDVVSGELKEDTQVHRIEDLRGILTLTQ